MVNKDKLIRLMKLLDETEQALDKFGESVDNFRDIVHHHFEDVFLKR